MISQNMKSILTCEPDPKHGQDEMLNAAVTHQGA